MKKAILFLFFLQLPGLTNIMCAQESVMHPYVGVNIVVLGYWSKYNGDIEIGFGIESGLVYNNFYIGGEYGVYGIIIYEPVITVLRPIDYIRPDELQTTEQYYGFHLGIVINKWLWLGAVFLGSTATVNHFAHDSTRTLNSTQFQQTWFNMGPDIRINPSTHLLLDFAYTVRRGLKLGCAYIF